MKRLHVKLVIRLERNEAHGRALKCLRNGLGVNEVTLVRFHVRFDVLGRNDANLVALVPESFPEEMSADASLHADQISPEIGG